VPSAPQIENCCIPAISLLLVLTTAPGWPWTRADWGAQWRGQEWPCERRRTAL